MLHSLCPSRVTPLCLLHYKLAFSRVLPPPPARCVLLSWLWQVPHEACISFFWGLADSR